MQKKKLEYSLVFVVTLLLLVEVIISNYKYNNLSKQKFDLSNKLALQQEIINNRNYVLTALNALEIMLDNNASAQLMKLNEHLPKNLTNFDFRLSPALIDNYRKLHRVLDQYLLANNNSAADKSFISLQVTAIKTELETVLQENYTENNRVVNIYHSVLKSAEEVFKLILGLLVLTLFNFYYFIKLITKDHKFKLNHISNNAYTQGIIQNAYYREIENKVVDIEHLCQKANYYNSMVRKQLQHQQELITHLQADHQNLNTIIEQQQSTDPNLKSSFKLQARAIEINDKICNSLQLLNKENKDISEQVEKNIHNIKNIFNTSQKISKVDSLELIAEEL